MTFDGVERTALNTKNAHVEYLAVLMAVCNAPETHESLINVIIHDCPKAFFKSYIGYLLILTKDGESWYNYLKCFLYWL